MSCVRTWVLCVFWTCVCVCAFGRAFSFVLFICFFFFFYFQGCLPVLKAFVYITLVWACAWPPCVHACVCRWDFCPLIPSCPLRPIRRSSARLQGWLALSPSLSSSPWGSAHLMFPWLHTNPLQNCIILCVTATGWGLKAFIRPKASWRAYRGVDWERKTRVQKHSPSTKTLLYDVYRQLHFPGSLIRRLTGHLHIMEIWFNLLRHTGLIATDSDASKPRGCCTSSLTAELQAAHRQYFYPWKNSPPVCCTFTLPSFWFVRCLFFPCREDSKQRVWAVNKFPPPTHTTTHSHSHTVSAVSGQKELSETISICLIIWLLFHMSHAWITGQQAASLSHLEEVEQRNQSTCYNCRKRTTVRENVCGTWNTSNNNKAAWQLSTAEM